jgi:hypothetical protein
MTKHDQQLIIAAEICTVILLGLVIGLIYALRY